MGAEPKNPRIREDGLRRSSRGWFGLGTAEMPARKVWRCYGTEPLPSREEALTAPLRGLPELVSADRMRPVWP
jgi:hypothetical protein